MALDHFGFIFTGRGMDPATHRSVIEEGDFRTVVVGCSSADQGVDVARAMVADGVQLIELCGGFGPVWTGRIIEAIDGAVPVGSVGYGPESIDGMARLFPPSD
ncbi:hypothetical protein IEQ44_05820 [Nocardioides sp. Y6]|uniref:B12-binding domain-containing protein n=1 Tax=Nocardioides malaquae TaxID=2773426 RepID=A0ABR9RRH2_9ACTN|nr:DUF6506 family protein [Nocardioides malaquae]MBE7324163.1 hypothetical protein [Nocardioides malaquae]